MKKTFVIKSSEEMIALGDAISKQLQANMVIALIGDLGAGKTTITKGIAKGLDIKDIVNSPTFTIMKIYQGRLPLYHMDVYRINNDSGDEYLEEYFEKDGVCVIEWADNIDEFLPEQLLRIEIEYCDEGRRVTLIGESLYEKVIMEI